jgi:hypothetical protein
VPIPLFNQPKGDQMSQDIAYLFIAASCQSHEIGDGASSIDQQQQLALATVERGRFRRIDIGQPAWDIAWLIEPLRDVSRG